jgi:hypothetical protein
MAGKNGGKNDGKDWREDWREKMAGKICGENWRERFAGKIGGKKWREKTEKMFTMCRKTTCPLCDSWSIGTRMISAESIGSLSDPGRTIG